MENDNDNENENENEINKSKTNKSILSNIDEKNSKEKYNKDRDRERDFNKNTAESKNNPSMLLKNFNDNDANNIEVLSEEEEINLKLNYDEISNINKEKQMDKNDISESSGAVVKLFSGEKNDIIEILKDKLYEKEKQLKFLLAELDKLKSKKIKKNKKMILFNYNFRKFFEF